MGNKEMAKKISGVSLVSTTAWLTADTAPVIAPSDPK